MEFGQWLKGGQVDEEHSGAGDRKVKSPEVEQGGIWKPLEIRSVAFYLGIFNALPSSSINI